MSAELYWRLAVAIAASGIDIASLITALGTLGGVAIAVWAHIENRALARRVEARESSRVRADHATAAARVSVTAYALQRQLQTMLDEAPAAVDTVVVLADQGNSFLVEKEMMAGALGIVSGRTKEAIDEAEKRIHRLMAEAPGVDESIARAVSGACVEFYEANARMEAALRSFNKEGVSKPEELATAVHLVRNCIEHLNEAIDPRLRTALGALSQGQKLLLESPEKSPDQNGGAT